MSKIFPSGFCVGIQCNDAIISVLVSHFTPPFPGVSNHKKAIHWKKIGVSEIAVEVGIFSGCPGCYLRNFGVIPTIEM